jgi:hypothetical protein
MAALVVLKVFCKSLKSIVFFIPHSTLSPRGRGNY